MTAAAMEELPRMPVTLKVRSSGSMSNLAMLRLASGLVVAVELRFAGEVDGGGIEVGVDVELRVGRVV